MDNSSIGTSSGGAPLMDQAREQVQRAADTTKDAAGRALDQARGQVMSQLSHQKERAVDTLGGVADALRKTGEQLRTGEQAAVGQYAATAADVIDSFSRRMQESDVDRIIDQVEDFARREPAIVLGGAFAIGFLAARFLKSSGDQVGWTRDRSDRDYTGSLRREPYEERLRGMPSQRRPEQSTGPAELSYTAGPATGAGSYGRYPGV